MGDITNVNMGVCSVTYNGVDLGHTEGDVVVTYAPDFFDRKVNKYGSTIVEKVLRGEALRAKVPLAEFTIANLEVAIPAGTDDGSESRVDIGKGAGVEMSQYAYQLVLHPEVNDASDRSEDVVIRKALSTGELEIGHNNDGDKILEVTFEGLLDETQSDGEYLGFIGDSTA